MKKAAHFIVFVALLLPFLSSGQGHPEPPVPTNPDDFWEVKKEMNAYFGEEQLVPGYKQWKRKEWFLEPRLYPSGKRENLTLKTYDAYRKYLRSYEQHSETERATHGSWTFLGPSECSVGLGRINAIEFHPTNANIMYVGAANGGIWKTTNGGSNWTNISPHIPLLSIADIKLSPSNSNVIYALTGDGDPDPGENGAHGQTEVSSIGILVSTDAGATWSPTNYSFDHPSGVVPVKLLIHPSNVNIQFVVGNMGIIRTDDLWQTWDTELFVRTYDIEFKPGNPNIMYASGDNWIRKSTDNGLTWNSISDSDFSSMSSASRVELAVAPSSSNVVYALAGNWSGGLQAFYQSTSEGNSNSWTLKNSTTTVMGQFTHYCVALTVDPNDHTDVFGGMQFISRSLDQGSSWTQVVQNTVHADLHDAHYRNGALWVACDGGIYKSTNEGNSWTDLTTGLAITEIYRIGGTPQNTDLYYMGTQDNGTLRRSGASSTFTQSMGADGMECYVDPTNTNVVYASSQNGFIAKSTSGGGNGSFGSIGVPGGTSAWITPYLIDPSNTSRIFVGKSSVYRSNSGGGAGTWTNLGSPTGGNLNCIALSANNSNRLYVSQGNNIERTDNALVATGPAFWTDINPGLPNLFITDIQVDPTNSTHVFVTMSGYSDGQKVYRSYSSGNSSSWVNISGSLPNVPVNCMAFAGNGIDAMYVGTDIGVFYRDNNLGDWIYYSNFLPAVNVSDLYLNTANNTLVAGTYGRGLWRTSVYDGCVADIVLYSLFGIALGGVHHYSAANSIASSANYRFDLGTEVHYKSANYIDLTAGFELGGLAFFEGKTGGCPGITSEPLMTPFVPAGMFKDSPHTQELFAPDP